MRLLLALAAVALLIVVWLPSRSASRSPAATQERVEEEGVAAKDRPPVEAGEVMGPGEEGGAYRLTVVSRRDGSPIAGARVLDSAGRGHGVTDENGIAVFRGEGDGWRVVAAGYFPVDPDFDEEGAGWVSLPPAAVVSGRVLDAASREPIAGVQVEIWAGDLRESDETSTDAAGRFELSGALWQEFWLVVRKDGCVPVEREGTLTGPLRYMEILLAAGATLRGYVLDIRERSHVYLTARGVPVPLLRSDVKEGAYRIDGVPLGVEVVPRSGDACGEPVTFLRAGEVQERDIREVGPVATLVVTARDAEGRAVEIRGATLAGHDDTGERSRGGRRFRVPPGRYTLRVQPEGWAEHVQEVVLAAGPARVDIVLEGGLAIEGRVVDAWGSPVVNSCVSWWNGTENGGVQTGPDGSFRIGGLARVPARLSVSCWRCAEAVCEGILPGGPPLLIALLPEARIVGRIAAPSIKDIDLHMWSDDFWSGGSMEEDGRFEFTVEYLGKPIAIAFRRRAEAPVLFEVPPLSAGQVHDLGEVPLDQGRTVRGSVLLPDGPAKGALVCVDEPWTAQCDMSTTRADALGRFCLLRMPKIPFFVRVDAGGFPRHFFRIEQDVVELRVSKGGVAEGRGRGALAPIARSRWTDTGYTELEPDANGDFRVRLQAGEYEAWFRDDVGRPLGEARFTIREGETTRAEPTPR